jgi:hypothetical protein
MSDTPETDNFIDRLNDDWDVEFAAVTAHAKKLERERDEARIQYRSTLALAEALANTQIELKKERDELRADQINHENLSMRYMDERDEALAQMCQAVGYLSTIAGDCEGWLNNQCDETACEFIKAVRDYAKKGMNA